MSILSTVPPLTPEQTTRLLDLFEQVRIGKISFNDPELSGLQAQHRNHARSTEALKQRGSLAKDLSNIGVPDNTVTKVIEYLVDNQEHVCPALINIRAVDDYLKGRA